MVVSHFNRQQMRCYELNCPTVHIKPSQEVVKHLMAPVSLKVVYNQRYNILRNKQSQIMLLYLCMNYNLIILRA